MRARIKRLLILILVCALLVNSDMAYLAMGVNMLYVSAAESEETVDLVGSEETVVTDDANNENGDDAGDDALGGNGDEGGDDAGDDTSNDTSDDTADDNGDVTVDGEDDGTESTVVESKEPLTIEQMLSMLEVASPEATLEDELVYLGADLNGVVLDTLSMAKVLTLLGVDTTGMDLSAVTVEGIRAGDYTLADILTMVQMRANDAVQTLASTSIIPTTADGLSGMGTTFTLSSYQDLINLQKLSQTTSLEGYTFTFLKILDETNQAQWNFSKADVDGNGYIGIGSETYPFKGTLNTYVSGMVCTISKPVCNYVSTGASFEGFNFSANGASASISQYLVTEEGSSAQNVALSNITVGGKIGSAQTAVAGGLFAYVENKTIAPIVLELGENSDDKNYSVSMTATVNGSYAGGIIGVVNSEDTSTGTVQIINKMSIVAGTVTGQGTAAGGIVGTLGKNATLTMDTASFQATVNGTGNNGGVVGIVENATFANAGALTVTTNVSSTNSLAAGGLIGKAQDAVSVTVDNVTLEGNSISSTAKTALNSKAGGIIGLWSDTDATARTSADAASFKNITIVSSTINGYDKAGVIGSLVGNNILLDTVTVDSATEIGDSANGLAGGVVGRIVGRNIEIKNSDITASQICGVVRGGIIGGIEGDAAGTNAATYTTQVRVENATVKTKFSVGNLYVNTGGIVGRAMRGSLLNLYGDIIVQAPDLGNGAYRGYIVGEQDTALVYFEDSTVRETFEANKTAVGGLYDNIGNYGGVIENTNGLIVYDAVAGKNVTGTISGTGVEGDPYKITCKEDLMRLAIALNTDGAFGADCFGVTADRAGAKQLRSAHYEITNSIDLTNTGIYDLSRNDKATESDSTEYAFQGTFAGSNANIAITLDSHDTNQAYIGLFPCVKNATFKNLIIKTASNEDGSSRPWRYAKNAAGIAPFVYGGLTLDTVTSEVHLVASQEAKEYYYGAIAGRMLLNKNHGYQVTTNNLTLAATIENVRVLQYVGGLAGGVNAVDGSVVTDFDFNGKTTISNKFTFTGDYNVSGWRTSYAGGLIGVIYTGNIQNKTFVTMNAEDVLVHNQILDYTGAWNVQNRADINYNDTGAGSFIGHFWDNVDADFTKITVTGEETRIEASDSNKLRMGGLFGRISGKLYLHDVDLLAGEFKNSVNGSSLLVSSGKWLICMLDEYTIDSTNVKVTNIPTYFDEIMGMNIITYAVRGGIVSIKSDGFKDMSEPGYVNQLLPVTQKNDFTRYYYNLFEQSPTEYTEGMIENDVLDTPAKLMAWHIDQYGTEEMDRFIKGYFGTGSAFGDKYAPHIIKGTIDLKGYSYYPTPYCHTSLTGEENATIIFYGDELHELEDIVITDRGVANKRHATNSVMQQYRMHTGLLYNPNLATVKDITFTGSVTNIGETSGAIAVGGCNTLTLENITVDDLHVTNYSNVHRIGLLIGIVNDNSTVTLKGIKVTGYDDTVWGQGAGTNKYAASALIGRVGYNNLNNTVWQSKNIKIYFSDMEVPYVRVKEDVSNAPVKTESPFRYASFIDTYEYTSDTDLYKGQGLYLFTQAEYEGTTNNGVSTVTLGKEISYGLMYDDNMVSLPTAVLDEAEANYLPYVCDTCSQTTIQVNPKRGDLLEGCGTYEDPYVLNSAKQIFQLYQYLSPKSVDNDTYLTGWRVNQLGVHDTHVVTTYGEDDFPSRDELRTAYYVVTADIDLTTSSDINDYVISNDFDGIGSGSYPFAGVIYGADATNKYTITLPGQDKGKSKTNYGLINTMKGAVIKDLNINTIAASDTTKKDEIYVNQSGGSVAAKIVGGDNIIDNVTVNTTLTANYTSTILGGYVGIIEKGGLIVRNLETSDLTGFYPLIMNNNAATDNETDKVSAIVGKVKDGYLLYEGNVNGAVDTTKKVLAGTDFGFGADALELSKTFQMVNGGYLEAETSTDKIDITVDDTAKTTSVMLSNDAHLEIIALALNSDGLSSYSMVNATNYNGYDTAAICRKAAYDSMGSSGTTDEVFAKTYDDGIYNFPYLIYKYCQVNGGDSTANYGDLYTTVNSVVVSKLNKLPGATDYTTTYNLANGTYDMTEYQYAFRGLGELYDTTPTISTDTRYSRFYANFDGGSSTIIANMNVDYDTDILTTGLFNDLYNFNYCKDYTATDSQTNTIKNLIVEGEFINTASTTTSRRVGAIAGGVYGNWSFENITLQKLNVTGNDAAGGLIGRILMDVTTTNTQKLSYTFKECKILGTKDSSGNMTDAVTINALDGAGGFVGVVSARTEGSYWYGGILECTGSQIDGLEVYSQGGSVGGIIGSSGNLIDSQYDFDNNTLTNMTLVATTVNGSNVGGLIGNYIPVPWTTTVKTVQHVLNITNTTVSDSTISSLADYTTDHNHGIGGLVGLIGLKQQNDANSTFTFSQNVVEDVTLGQWVDENGNTTVAEQPVGGLVGISYGDKLVIKDCTVRNTVSPTDANAAVFTTRGTDIGGLVGNMQTRYCEIDYKDTTDLTLESEVTGGVASHIENLKLVATKGTESNWATTRGTRVGGLLGYTSGTNKSLVISDVKVSGCYLETEAVYDSTNADNCGAGGLVGIIATVNDTDTTKTEVQLNNILVANSEFIGGESGGLVGVTRMAEDKGYNILAQNIAVRKNIVYGQAAGGVFGNDYAAGADLSNNYKNIIIDSNKIGAIKTTSDYIWAGGFTGRANASTVGNNCAKQYYNDVVISNNYIVGYGPTYANMCVGGMFGLLSTGTSTKDWFIYNPVLENNYIGVWNNGSDLSVYTPDALKAITADNVGILKYDTTAKKLVIEDSLPDTMEEKEIQYYATNIGSIAGKMETNFWVYILRPEITFDSVEIRPVVDLGVPFTVVNSGREIDGNYSIADSSYPYSYRGTFKVIYFEPQTTASTVGEDVMNVFDNRYGEDEYLFDDIDDIMTEYAAIDNVAAQTDKLLDAYRLNTYYQATNGSLLTMRDIYEKSYYNGSTDAAVIAEKGVTKDLYGIPLIVYDAQNGSAVQVINSYLAMLTNGMNLSTSANAKTITARRALVKDGVITYDTSATPSLSASGSNVTYNHYDTYDATKGTSITVLEITYSWTTGLGETVRDTIYLPVYVLERLDVRSFLRMEEGAVYSYDEMKNSTIGNGTNKHSVIMANDTTYTMAIEFLYGSGRNKFENETVNKILKLTEETVGGTKPKALAPGTRLTLIDVETGYAYYYEATRENQLLIEQGVKKGISFTDFTKVLMNNSTAYENRTMAQINDINSDALQASYKSLDTGNKVYTNVGVERYLLIVDGSHAETENVLYDITVVADESQNNNSKDIYPADIINVTSIPGLKVGFEGKGTRTTISGQMMRSQEVLINVVYGIKAQKLEGQGSMDEAPYWTMASSNEVIDSSNNSKYLELAIYLQDKKGNRVTLPQNTSISMNGQMLTASGSQSVFYFYKDTMDTESLDGMTGDKEWEEQIRLGFETAILDSYNDEYSMVVELLRTDDPQYPMSGDKPDYYGDEISAHIQTDLAVAVLADDLLSLGINTYMEETHDYEIPFTSMIDFGSVVEFDLEDGEDVVNAQLAKWCDETEYRITYRMYKKVETAHGKEYVPIGNDRISLWREDENAEGGYSLWTSSTDTNGQIVYNETRTFTKDEVQNGTNNAKGLITDKLLLKVNTEGITQEELSNYKLEMSVIAYDSETTTDANGVIIPAAPTGDEAVLKDFFIFTIAKLKTDME